jgi:uncharacterized phage-associated protein
LRVSATLQVSGEEGLMANVHDVAAHIIEKCGAMSTMKLQKLAYYSQAWHLVWDDEALFADRIEAWANGPVTYALFDRHRGAFSVSSWDGDSNRLSTSERDTVDAVIDAYGALDGRKLSHLTHSEGPWLDARAGLSPSARSNQEITPQAMLDYYGSIDASPEAVEVDEINWDPWETKAPL